MARILSSEGLVMNQSNTNPHMRYYSRGKNDVGGLIRFTIGAGNPHVHIMIKAHIAFTQTNANDFHSSLLRWDSLDIDTGGTVWTGFGYSQYSGASLEFGWTTATRQADWWLQSPNNGGWAGRSSVFFEIYCDRWDYVTVTNL